MIIVSVTVPSINRFTSFTFESGQGFKDIKVFLPHPPEIYFWGEEKDAIYPLSNGKIRKRSVQICSKRQQPTYRKKKRKKKKIFYPLSRCTAPDNLHCLLWWLHDKIYKCGLVCKD